MQTLNLLPVTSYTVMDSAACTVTTADGRGLTTCTAGQQGYFTTDETGVTVLSSDTARVHEVNFNAAPGGGSGGGSSTVYELGDDDTYKIDVSATTAEVTRPAGETDWFNFRLPVHLHGNNLHHGAGASLFAQGSIVSSMSARGFYVEDGGSRIVELDSDDTGHAYMTLNGDNVGTRKNDFYGMAGACPTWDAWVAANPTWQTDRVVIIPQLFGAPSSISLPVAELVYVQTLPDLPNSRGLLAGISEINAPNATVVYRAAYTGNVFPQIGKQICKRFVMISSTNLSFTNGAFGFDASARSRKTMICELYQMVGSGSIGVYCTPYAGTAEKRNYFPRTYLLYAPRCDQNISLFADDNPCPLNKTSAMHAMNTVRRDLSSPKVLNIGLASDYFDAAGNMVDADLLAKAAEISRWWTVGFVNSGIAL